MAGDAKPAAKVSRKGKPKDPEYIVFRLKSGSLDNEASDGDNQVWEQLNDEPIKAPNDKAAIKRVAPGADEGIDTHAAVLARNWMVRKRRVRTERVEEWE